MSLSYVARRAAQKERVRILYRRALKDTLNWAVHRHLFYQDASDLRTRFDANKHLIIGYKITAPRWDLRKPKLDAVTSYLLDLLEDLDTIDRMIDDAEATYNKFRHPDPYIVPWAPGGSKFTRNPTPPSGIEIVYNYGREDND